LRLAVRQAKALPELSALRQWLEQQHVAALPKSLFGQAVQYALNHWDALLLYTQHGFLAIGRVERWRGGLGEPCVLPTLSVVGARVAPHTPSPPPAPRTGRADFPHPALIRTLKPSHSAWPSDGREPRTAPVPRRGNGPGTACSPYRPAVSAASATCGNAARRTDGPSGTPCRPVPG
jgi:transposase